MKAKLVVLAATVVTLNMACQKSDDSKSSTPAQNKVTASDSVKVSTSGSVESVCGVSASMNSGVYGIWSAAELDIKGEDGKKSAKLFLVFDKDVTKSVAVCKDSSTGAETCVVASAPAVIDDKTIVIKESKEETKSSGDGNDCRATVEEGTISYSVSGNTLKGEGQDFTLTRQ